MYVYISISIYLYIYVSLHLYIYIYSQPFVLCAKLAICIQQQLCSYVCTCLYMSVHVHVLALTCTFKYFFKLSTALIITTLNHSLPNSWLPPTSLATPPRPSHSSALELSTLSLSFPFSLDLCTLGRASSCTI